MWWTQSGLLCGVRMSMQDIVRIGGAPAIRAPTCTASIPSRRAGPQPETVQLRGEGAEQVERQRFANCLEPRGREGLGEHRGQSLGRGRHEGQGQTQSTCLLGRILRLWGVGPFTPSVPERLAVMCGRPEQEGEGHMSMNSGELGSLEKDTQSEQNFRWLCTDGPFQRHRLRGTCPRSGKLRE